MPDRPPRVAILAGPNGSGKSTSAAKLLLGPLQVSEFVNADTIAQGLSAFDAASVALTAGRIMRERLRELARARAEFAFETTLAARSYAPWLRQLQADGYLVELVFLWLPSPDLAVARVADRVAAGGHAIPESVIRRRYAAGLANLCSLYIPLADRWSIIDNSQEGEPRTIAEGGQRQSTEILDTSAWQSISSAQ
ncbi:MAG: AAA family ATPase [Planctomycetales bacterium]|nr:AAA family ATPase [Planctomycetales bacterium]